MSEDYFTHLDRRLAELTRAGAHLDPADRRWSMIEQAARRTAAVVSVAIILAAMLVIEFPGSASGRAHRVGGLVAAEHPAPALTAGPVRSPLGRDA